MRQQGQKGILINATNLLWILQGHCWSSYMERECCRINRISQQRAVIETNLLKSIATLACTIHCFDARVITTMYDVFVSVIAVELEKLIPTTTPLTNSISLTALLFFRFSHRVSLIHYRIKKLVHYPSLNRTTNRTTCFRRGKMDCKNIIARETGPWNLSRLVPLIAAELRYTLGGYSRLVEQIVARVVSNRGKNVTRSNAE